MSKTIFTTQESPANALALNKDNTQVVIAGRNVFKIFQIDEQEFVEVSNLRVGKNLNLNFSCNDVAWNSLEDNILATAATNGAVVVWDLNRGSRSKQEHVFVDHKRTVNKVCFHPVEASWLISGSQDGTMKLFDLRVKEAIKTFVSNTESVRDVQFSPHANLGFASVSENGNVQTWDMRRADKCVLQFTAHSGPIFACDWHPDTTWLATASRDRTIKVWEMSGKPALEYTISTIASVGRVKWRPHNKYHVASVALVVDCTVNVWDVRRPYIPYAAFTRHKDIPTGLAWRGDPYILLTTSRDCTLYQHIFKDAIYPAAHANPQALSISALGEIAFATRVIVSPAKPNKIQGFLRRTTGSNDDFCQATSSLHIFKRVVDKELNCFFACVDKYILTGKTLTELCDHNAQVAKSLGRLAVSLLWSTVKTLYTPRAMDQGYQSPSKEETDRAEKERQEAERARKDAKLEEDQGPRLGDSMGDFYFGDADMDPLSMEFEINGLEGLISQDWTLQMEAFPLRHEILNRSPPPEQYTTPHTPESVEELETGTSDGILGLVVTAEKIVTWEAGPIIAKALRHHAAEGDVQTPVCILTALGDKRSSLLSFIDLDQQEEWVLAYLDILSQHRLWLHASQIIDLCWLPQVSQLNQQSTSVYTSCSRCSKPLTQNGWLCSKCKEPLLCSYCHQVVHGLYAWCQGCLHGGHLNHMRDWITINKYCPTGCGHACQYI